ncbi:MAG: hypothetical protein KME12_14480 [Trichocoleus desertorum ATA4-8-CV12]|jgi:hypothetical protein|nr:hypothetical protein [Trichocoleus desertorum ATA4-8-CV12]
MIEIRFGDSPHGIEIELSGLPKDLRNVQQSILNLVRNKSQQFYVIKAAIVDPFPYKVCLSSLHIYKNDSFVRVWVSENSLQIEGDSEKLEIFAAWFEFDDGNVEGYHHHFDYYGNEWWVNANSNPLVISVRDPVQCPDTA